MPVNLQKIDTTHHIESFAQAVAIKIASNIQTHSQVNLYLSGGSALEAYAAVFAKLPNLSLEKLHVRLVDERVFPRASIRENIRQTNSYQIANQVANQNGSSSDLIEIIKKKGGNIEFLPPEKEALEFHLERYNQMLSKEFVNEEVAQIAILGIGEDGHIAGIKPFSNVTEFNNLFLKPGVYTALYSSADFPFRQTLTLSALRKMTTNFVFAKKDKTGVIDLLLDHNRPQRVWELPGQIIHVLPHCQIFLES